MPRSIVTIGVFDGVHLGHRAILAHARRLADELDASGGVVAITFDRHPQAVLRPGSQPPRLLPTDEKVRRLRAAGADEVIVHAPDPALLGLTAEDFIRQIVDEHAPAAIIEGEDFRFGKGRRGDPAMLRALGERFGFRAIIEPKVEVGLTDRRLVPVSSSLVRWLVGHGRVMDAAICLAQPFALTARVAKGDQRGRTIGIPTANLDPADYAEFILPPDGVYAGAATIHPPRPEAESAERSNEDPDSHRQPPTYPAAISIGDKPTFAGRQLTVEAHLLDYTPPSMDHLYGQTITLTFNRWLRDQYPFPGVSALKGQIARDIAETRRLHDRRMLAPAALAG